jgi:hypothetical protein
MLAALSTPRHATKVDETYNEEGQGHNTKCGDDNFCEATEVAGVEDQDGYDNGGRVADRSTLLEVSDARMLGAAYQEKG